MKATMRSLAEIFLVDYPKPGEVLDDALVSLAGSRIVACRSEDLDAKPKAGGDIGYVSLVEVFRREASPTLAEVGRVQPEADLVARIAQTGRPPLKGQWQVEGGLALSRVHQRRGIKGAVLGRRENLHTGHACVSFDQQMGFAILYL